MYNEKLSDVDINGIKALYNPLKFYKIVNEFSSFFKCIDKNCDRWDDYTQNDYSVFSRFEMFNFEEYDKIIYLDSDIIVNKSIDYLINECNDSECYAGPVQDRPHFNAGVLVINKKTTFGEYKKRCVDILTQSENLYGNQPVFNKCFERTVTRFPQQYNLTVIHQHVKKLLADDQVVILHFPGGPKPWSNGPKFSSYYLYADESVRNKFLQIWNHYADLYKKLYQ